MVYSWRNIQRESLTVDALSNPVTVVFGRDIYRKGVIVERAGSGLTLLGTYFFHPSLALKSNQQIGAGRRPKDFPTGRDVLSSLRQSECIDELLPEGRMSQDRGKGVGISGAVCVIANEERAEPYVVWSYRQILVTAGPVRRRRLWADGQRAWR
jgi:hypothetical protein